MTGGDQVPPVIASFDGELTEAQLDELKRRFDATANDPRARRRARHATLRCLPARTRLRLRSTHCADVAACWLMDHVHWRAGEWLWRLTGLWRAR